jgi:hypothetical protein
LSARAAILRRAWLPVLVLAALALSFVLLSPIARAQGERAEFIIMASAFDPSTGYGLEPLPFRFGRDGQEVEVVGDDHPVFSESQEIDTWHTYEAIPYLQFENHPAYPGQTTCWGFDYWEVSEYGVSNIASNPLTIQVDEFTRRLNARYIRVDGSYCQGETDVYPYRVDDPDQSSEEQVVAEVPPEEAAPAPEEDPFAWLPFL